jgi:GDP-mannose 6-dehydrogenase
LKVAFANEIGSICRAVNVDSHELMAIFCKDTKLNLSPTYLRPGYAFGGSCLPKDLRALTHLARSRDLQVPVLEGVLASNTAHKQRALELITALGKKRVGVLGLSFKDGTDDLRESPTVELIEQLIGKGFAVRVFDPDVSLTRLTGSNKAFIDRELPHIASLLSEDVIALIESSDVLVATKASRRYADVLNMARADQTVIDFVRLRQRAFDGQGTYDALVG